MKLVFIVDTYFPYGVAMSSRVRCFCKLFRDIGYSVHVIALFTKEKELISNQIYEFDGFTYEIISNKNSTSINSFFANNALVQRLISYVETNGADAILSLACPLYFYKILEFARTKNIPYIVEQSEWQDITNYKFGVFDPRFRRIQNLRRNGYKNATGIISISRYLDNHYKKMGIPSIRIPTILDVLTNKTAKRFDCNGKIIIVYTGNPGISKEFLGPVIECIANNEELRAKIVFHIYGPSYENVVKNIGGRQELLLLSGKSVQVHGSIPQNDIEEVLKKSHFQIFLRPMRLSSEAGFPTKLGESMAVGTPVLTNETGDIPLYLKDDFNGYMLSGIKSDDVKSTFYKLISLTAEEYYNMSYRARLTAERYFDYRSYISLMENFLNNII